MILTVAAIGIGFSLVAIILPGLVMLASLNRRGILRDRSFSGNFIAAVALGCLWAAFSFITLYKVGVFGPSSAAQYILLGLDALMLAALVFSIRPFQELRWILESFCNWVFLILVVAGLGLGTFSLVRFPHVLDSGQLSWTQSVLDGLVRDYFEPMIGFSGLIALPGSLFSRYPLATLAAGFKPLLCVLLLLVCHDAVAKLRIPYRAFSLGLLILLIMTSKFGIYGVIELGKDSIFGVLFSIAFLVALCRDDLTENAVAPSLYFAAASVMGVIAVPYMVIALALWLVFAAEEVQARAVMMPFILVNALMLPIVAAGTTKKPYWVMAVSYLVATALLALLERAKRHGGLRQLDWVFSRGRSLADRILPALPLICFAGGAMLFPVTAEFPVWFNADGSVITEVKPPFDGKTGMADLLFSGPYHNAVVLIGIVVLLTMGLSRRASPAKIAVASMPLAAIMIALIHLRLGLHFLSLFNQWDMVRDIPEWYGGAMFSIFTVAGVANIGEEVYSHVRILTLEHRFLPRILGPCFAVIFAVVVLIWPNILLHGDLARLEATTYYTDIGGSIDKDWSIVSREIWMHFRGITVFIHPNAIPNFFYSVQMYGGHPSQYDASALQGDLSRFQHVGFIVPDEELFDVIRYSRREKASLKFLASLDSGKQAVIEMTFDGKNNIAVPDLPDALGHLASIRNGAYSPESYRTVDFRWLGKSVEVEVPMTDEIACVQFEAFRAASDSQPNIIKIEGGNASPVSFDLARASLDKPKLIAVTLHGGGNAPIFHFEAQMPEIQFPNDPRRVAWGIVLPVTVDPGKACVNK